MKSPNGLRRYRAGSICSALLLLTSGGCTLVVSSSSAIGRRCSHYRYGLFSLPDGAWVKNKSSPTYKNACLVELPHEKLKNSNSNSCLVIMLHALGWESSVLLLCGHEGVSSGRSDMGGEERVIRGRVRFCCSIVFCGLECVRCEARLPRRHKS